MKKNCCRRGHHLPLGKDRRVAVSAEPSLAGTSAFVPGEGWTRQLLPLSQSVTQGAGDGEQGRVCSLTPCPSSAGRHPTSVAQPLWWDCGWFARDSGSAWRGERPGTAQSWAAPPGLAVLKKTKGFYERIRLKLVR